MSFVTHVYYENVTNITGWSKLTELNLIYVDYIGLFKKGETVLYLYLFALFIPIVDVFVSIQIHNIAAKFCMTIGHLCEWSETCKVLFFSIYKK